MKNLLNLIIKIDKFVINYFDENCNNKIVANFFKVFTQFGKAGIYAIIISLIMFSFSYTRNLSYILGTTIVCDAIIVNVFLKNIFKRARPYHKYPHIKTFIKHPKDYSFPSGHTAMSSACMIALFYIGIVYNFNFLYFVINIIFIILMGYSRLYLRVHFLSDVVLGMIIGIMIGISVILLKEEVIYMSNIIFVNIMNFSFK